MTDQEMDADSGPVAWIAVGLGVVVLGAVTYFVGEDQAKRVGSVIGLALLLLGTFAVSIGSIGYGVLIGLRKHDQETIKRHSER